MIIEIDPHDVIINGRELCPKSSLETIIDEMDSHPLYKQLIEMTEFFEDMEDWGEYYEIKEIKKD
ncbi:MAG: hypothetical protein ACFFAO_12470 [Candidatus Hermodarchaeota archaeon]